MDPHGSDGAARMRGAVAVSRASGDDVGALVRLMQAFYVESGMPLDGAWATSAFVDLLDHPERGAAWLARCNDEPVGHVVLTVRYAMEHGGLQGHVDDLFVSPAWRRRGVAHGLLQALMQECRVRGCRAVQVEVARDNAAARAAYARFGLRPFEDERLLLAGALPQADD